MGFVALLRSHIVVLRDNSDTQDSCSQAAGTFFQLLSPEAVEPFPPLFQESDGHPGTLAREKSHLNYERRESLESVFTRGKDGGANSHQSLQTDWRGAQPADSDSHCCARPQILGDEAA